MEPSESVKATGISGKIHWIDTHAHLDSDEFAGENVLSAIMERAHTSGAIGVLIPSVDIVSLRRVRRIVMESERTDSEVSLRFGAGIQPHSTHEVRPDDWPELSETSKDPYCVAIGEIGLDYYHDFSPPETQRECFVRQLRLARQRNLPVLIHCREG
ncbi:MAG: TatD family hydrolase, partial [Planctomycetia bacterium]|nr:TatD family hydrolase [Planctomycetia bacterium]